MNGAARLQALTEALREASGDPTVSVSWNYWNGKESTTVVVVNAEALAAALDVELPEEAPPWTS